MKKGDRVLLIKKINLSDWEVVTEKEVMDALHRVNNTKTLLVVDEADIYFVKINGIKSFSFRKDLFYIPTPVEIAKWRLEDV